MGRRLHPEHLELYKRIDELLWNGGSPLGSAGTPEDRDEYFHYLPRVFRMTVEGSSCSTIADYLRSIAQRQEGSSFDAQRCTEIASCILREKRKTRQP